MPRMSKKAKQALNQSFVEDLFNAGEKLELMMAVNSWEADGYDSLLGFFADRCKDLPFTLTDKVMAAYRMLDDGAEPEEIAEAMTGISVEGAQNLKRQKEQGVPAGSARPNYRRKITDRIDEDRPRPPRDTLFLRLGAPVVQELEERCNLEYEKSATERATELVMLELEYLRRRHRIGA